MYYRSAGEADPARATVPHAVGEDVRHYWCALTCRGLGPGGADLGADLCVPDRACFEDPVRPRP